MNEYVVGYVVDEYPTRRNIIGRCSDAKYARTRDVYKLLHLVNRTIRKLTGASPVDGYAIQNQFNDFGYHRVGLLHLFNQVSHGPTPWVSTFETALPRFGSTMSRHRKADPSFRGIERDKRVVKAARSMAGPACRRLIAMSRCAARIQTDLLSQLPAEQDAIAGKLTVLHPPQALSLNSYERKKRFERPEVNFMMVGSAFFHKGGMEVLETFRELRRQENYAIHLHIVSDLSLEGFAGGETAEDQARARHLIAANKDWITHYTSLPNEQVIELMCRADVGLLPTYADTYGFSVLEFQSAGCPVITTDVRALPEINDERSGWLISVPKNRLGESLHETAQGRERISLAIRAGLERAVREIAGNQAIVAEKGRLAFKRIGDDHDPDRYAESLAAIYEDCLRYEATGRVWRRKAAS